MHYVKTTAVDKISRLKKRLKIIQGGSSAGKTIAILLLLIDRAQSTSGKTISVISETVPHLKRGAIRDFLSIMESHNYFKESNWNRTDYIYNFESGSKIEFFSADTSAKVRGPRRDTLFINEANNISLETFTQLAIRTNEDIFIDYNPVSEFWVHTEIIPKRDHDFIILTYKDNEALSSEIVQEIESRRESKNFWKVYGLGQLGEVEGKIYRDWDIIDDIPRFARLEGYGIDFGYTNDPTAIVGVWYADGGYIWDEVCYQKGMSNRQIADTIKAQERPAIVVADSAEPKSIDEIKSYGINIQPSVKGKDSVLSGIQLIQDRKICLTKRSVNLIKEYRNYLWMTDKDGVILNKPEHEFSHGMDSGRYLMWNLLRKPKPKMVATEPLKAYYPELGF